MQNHENLLQTEVPVDYPKHFEGPRHRAATLELAAATYLIVHQNKLVEEGLLDPVTGLRNRKSLVNDLESFYENPDNSAGDISIMFLDMDGLKRVNDSADHNLGDEYIKTVADGLMDVFGYDTGRGYDRVYRLGGDEFVVLIDRRHDEKSDREKRPDKDDGFDGLGNLIERTRSNIDAKIKSIDSLKNFDTLGVSIGVSTIAEVEDENGQLKLEDAGQLIKRADTACKKDKDERYNNRQGRKHRRADKRLGAKPNKGGIGRVARTAIASLLTK